MAFRGHFEFSLDAKNRLTLPAKLRASFSGGLVLAKWIDPCVAIFTPEDFDAFKSSFMSELHPLSAQRRQLNRFFNGGAFGVGVDTAGPVTPQGAPVDHRGRSQGRGILGA